MKLLRIILPSILCVLVIVITKISIEYYPLSFGLILGFINWDKHKYNIYIGLLTSLIASYVSFFIAYFSFPLIAELLSFLGPDKSAMIAFIVSPFIIAPSLVFISYKYVFNYQIKTKLNLLIMISSIILLVTYLFINVKISENQNTSMDFNHFFNAYTIWQIVMALGIQLIIYQKEIFVYSSKDI